MRKPECIIKEIVMIIIITVIIAISFLWRPDCFVIKKEVNKGDAGLLLYSHVCLDCGYIATSSAEMAEHIRYSEHSGFYTEPLQ